jgi:methylthioribulose-1-phosphate dehydratase
MRFDPFSGIREPTRRTAIILRMTEPLPGTEHQMRTLLCELLRAFYDRGWVSGSGGGICGVHDGRLLVAPTGVHKERVRPEDLFVVDAATGQVTQPPARRYLKPSECTSIFCAIIAARGAGSIVHSHALSSVLVGDLVGDDDALTIRDLEMLKGLPGVSNRDEHLVPVIDNTEREHQLTEAVAKALDDPRFANAHAILVRDHGAYIWGSDVWDAKKHAEVYHFLFEATRERAPMRTSTPGE